MTTSDQLAASHKCDYSTDMMSWRVDAGGHVFRDDVHQFFTMLTLVKYYGVTLICCCGSYAVWNIVIVLLLCIRNIQRKSTWHERWSSDVYGRSHRYVNVEQSQFVAVMETRPKC